MLAHNPSAAYRRVDLDARVEAAASGDLARICLEQVVDLLAQALLALGRAPDRPPRDTLAKAHGIALWLAQSVDPDNPLRTPLLQFYGGQAERIRRSITVADADEIAAVRADFVDLLAAANGVD